MRKRALIIAAIGVLAALAVAAIAIARTDKPASTTVGNLKLTANGSVTPNVLPKKTSAPITLKAEGKIETTDNTHPPAVKEVEIETDKNGTINVKGFPTCRLPQLQSTDTSAAEATCKPALIGTGHTTVEVAFPEQKPFNVQSKLLVFNGGERGGKVTLYIHAYFNAPITGAIVTTVTIKKIHHGPYGLLSTAVIPKIASGSGSVTAFNLKIGKKFTYKGKKQSILNLKCPTGKIPVHVTGVFSDGTKASVELPRTCTGKG
jgi:hypothetical protein